MIADQPPPPRSTALDGASRYRLTLDDGFGSPAILLPAAARSSVALAAVPAHHDAAWPSSHRRGRTRSYAQAVLKRSRGYASPGQNSSRRSQLLRPRRSDGEAATAVQAALDSICLQRLRFHHLAVILRYAVMLSVSGATETYVAQIPVTLGARVGEQSRNARSAHSSGTAGFRSRHSPIFLKRRLCNSVLAGSSGGLPLSGDV